MSKSDTIVRSAYWLADPDRPLIGRYRAMPYPEDWQPALLNLWQHDRGDRHDKFRTIPTRRLEGVLQALAPDLVIPSRPWQLGGGQEPDPYWLYAAADRPDPLPGPTLPTLCTTWLRDLRPEPEYLGLVAETLTELRADPPTWDVGVDVDLLGCPTTTGGTARPHHRQYRLAADHIARAIAKQEPYPYGEGRHLHFRAVPRGRHDQGAELVSQPLSWVDGEHRQWWWSVYLNVALLTVPFSPAPRLHLTLGTRRWATRPAGSEKSVYLPHGRHTTVYLRPRTPWLVGTPASDRYALARLRWNRKDGAVGWAHGDCADMLDRLSTRFPSPQDILDNSEDWIRADRPVQAMVVHSTQMGSHGVGAGLMPNQRSQIIEWAEPALTAIGLTRLPNLRRSSRSDNKILNAAQTRFPTRLDDDAAKAKAERAAVKAQAAIETARKRRRAVAINRPDRVDLRLLWQTEQTRDAAIAALRQLLDLPGDGETGDPGLDRNQPFTLTWTDEDRYTVRLRCRKLTDDCATNLKVRHPRRRPDGLPLPEAIRTRRDDMARLITTDRVAMAAAGLEAESSVVLSLVELGGRTTFKDVKGDDPKFALRLGCADVGVLTQFIRTPDTAKDVKDLPIRACAAWGDGLRQLGVRVWPQHTLAGQIPENLHYLAFWMVARRQDTMTRQKGYVPVAVLLQPGPPSSGIVRALGWEQATDSTSGRWIPYPEMLLGLTRFADTTDDPDYGDLLDVGKPSPTFTRDERRQETYHLIQKVLQSSEVRGHPVALLVCAQNSRGYWDWQQDQNLIVDRIRTGNAPAARLPEHLRVVRLRTSTGHETPQWWVPTAGDAPNGLAAGLWYEEPTDAPNRGHDLCRSRVFYSTTEKPATARDAAVGADRLAPREKKQGKDKGGMMLDTAQVAWNPMLLEIVTAGCQNVSSDQGHSEIPEAGDDPEALAFAVHQLRQAPDYLAPLGLPLPMHLAKLAGAYVLPTSDKDLDGDESEEEVETASEVETFEQPTLF